MLQRCWAETQIVSAGAGQAAGGRRKSFEFDQIAGQPPAVEERRRRPGDSGSNSAVEVAPHAGRHLGGAAIALETVEIEERGAKLVGVSVDSRWAHKAFQEKLGIDIPLLADFHPKGEVSRAYGAYIEERGHPNRSLVLIDENGVVRWAHESPSPAEIPGANLIFDALANSD